MCNRDFWPWMFDWRHLIKKHFGWNKSCFLFGSRVRVPTALRVLLSSPVSSCTRSYTTQNRLFMVYFWVFFCTVLLNVQYETFNCHWTYGLLTIILRQMENLSLSFFKWGKWRAERLGLTDISIFLQKYSKYRDVDVASTNTNVRPWKKRGKKMKICSSLWASEVTLGPTGVCFLEQFYHLEYSP